MWPIGDYDRLLNELRFREDQDIPVIFGVLVADYRQSSCREYMLNYLERFNDLSGEYINFYLPGYLDDDHFKNNKVIKISNKNYYFHNDKYMEFLNKLGSDFRVSFPYNPILILFEFTDGKFGQARRIIIDLDRDGNDVRDAGVLFENVFELAKEFVQIDDISNGLRRKVVSSGLINRIVDLIGNDLLKNIKLLKTDIDRYKIKSR